MAHSSPRPDSICGRISGSTFALTKSLFGSHTLEFSVMSSSRWKFSRLKMVCGTEFPGRTFKANCRSCLSKLQKKRQKAACPLRPSVCCSNNSANEFIRRSHCIWFSKTKRNLNSDGCSVNGEQRSIGTRIFLIAEHRSLVADHLPFVSADAVKESLISPERARRALGSFS